MKKLTISCTILLITVMLVTILMGLCGCAQVRQKKTVTSVEAMSLTFSSYHEGSRVYELAIEDGKTELRHYQDVYTSEGFALELVESAAVDTDELVELMNSCGVLRWDGFHGKYPSGVMDGSSYGFTATVNGTETIVASGYMSYPIGFRDFYSELLDMLKEVEETE